MNYSRVVRLVSYFYHFAPFTITDSNYQSPFLGNTHILSVLNA